MIKGILKFLSVAKEKRTINEIWMELMVHFDMYNNNYESFGLNGLVETEHGYTAKTKAPFGLTANNLEEMVEHFNFYQDKYELKLENLANSKSSFKLNFVKSI